MQDMEHGEWLKNLTRDTTNGAAERAGITPTTLFRQVEKGRISAQNVIALAHAYGAKAGDQLLATGHITADDLDGIGVKEALARATNKEFLDEMERRLEMGIGGVFTEPMSTVEDDRADLNESRHLAAVADDSPDENDHPEYDESSWDA